MIRVGRKVFDPRSDPAAVLAAIKEDGPYPGESTLTRARRMLAAGICARAELAVAVHTKDIERSAQWLDALSYFVANSLGAEPQDAWDLEHSFMMGVITFLVLTKNNPQVGRWGPDIIISWFEKNVDFSPEELRRCDEGDPSIPWRRKRKIARTFFPIATLLKHGLLPENTSIHPHVDVARQLRRGGMAYS